VSNATPMTDAAFETPTVPHWQDAIIAGKKRQTRNITSFFLKPMTYFQWRAGQHVDIRLTAPNGYRAIRSYSIAAAPGDSGIVELAIERLTDGEVSTFFHDVAEVGDTIELKGPLGGHFVWSPDVGGPILLIGAGSGLVPLMAMVRHRTASGTPPPFQLLLSARTWEDVLYREELEGLDGHDGFGFALAITRAPTQTRPGIYSRRIDPSMIREVLRNLPGPPSRTFICGTNGFANAAADGVIAAGIAANTIRTERYGGA
jgi:ferredoxin-NADP reductase